MMESSVNTLDIDFCENVFVKQVIWPLMQIETTKNQLDNIFPI